MKAKLAVLAIVAAFASSAFAVDMHGYFRDGVGGSSKGGDQVAFGNAGQGYKLRLGNEDNWGEFAFDQLVLKDKNGVEWTAEFMIGWGDGWTSNANDVVSLELKQQWLKGTFPQLGGASVWGGKRYYHRIANDIFDYFYVNESGAGAGIEDFDVGFGKLAVAVFRQLPFASTTKAAATWMPDVRLENIPVNPGGTLTVGVLAKMLTWNKELLGDKPSDAASFSPFVFARHSQSGILDGGNNLAVVYKAGCFLDCHKDSRAFIVSDDLLLQPTKQFSVVIAGVYKNEKDALVSDKANSGYGIGVRPLFKVTDHFALQGDAGYFYNKTDISGSKANTMFKLNFSPTITPFTDGFAWGVRPEIRFYVNYASWNKEQSVGGGTFGTDESGLTFGTYVETWF
jgi:maltoporin